MEYYAVEGKKEFLPLKPAWTEMESIILSNISQMVKDKYHIISPIKQNLINKTNKQAKYKQRHWNKEQTNSNQRGGRKGIMGERMGRVIKEHV